MHVVVVGAGVFGTWAAHHLRQRGADVTLVEAYGAAHSRSSSGDETRVLRCGYGPSVAYAELARRSRDQWKELEARAGSGEALWFPCGVLWLAAADDAYAVATEATLRRLESAVVLSSSQVADRFPQFDVTNVGLMFLEPDGGVLAARRAVRSLVSDLGRRGVPVVRARITAPSAARASAVRGDDGVEVAGDRFVFACGAWLPTLFPSLLEGRIRPTRQVVLYFGTPAGDDRFMASHMPVWIDFAAGIYGTPDVDGRGVKVGIDEHGGPIDPDHDDRMADVASIERARTWLSRRIPLLADAPVVEARVCAYENTTNGDFLIDRHPDHDNVWIAGGGSGHGFKHGPAVGELVARMVLEGEKPFPQFALDSKTTDARRTIY